MIIFLDMVLTYGWNALLHVFLHSNKSLKLFLKRNYVLHGQGFEDCWTL